MTKSQLKDFLSQSLDDRHVFSSRFMHLRMISQIRALRKKNGLSLKKFAKIMKRSQDWAVKLEDPNESFPSIPTLLQIARVFDINFEMCFHSFSKLVENIFNPEPTMIVVPFDAEKKYFKK